MQAGKMRDLVDILAPVGTVQNSFGAVPKLPKKVATVWAEVLELSGLELIRAQKVVAEATYQVKVRWHPAIVGDSAKQVSLAGGKVLEILHVADPEQRWRELVLLCKG